jgi:lipid-A-disaccharide synthase
MRPIVGLLPGSRKAEMRRVAPTLMEATRIVSGARSAPTRGLHGCAQRYHEVCARSPGQAKFPDRAGQGGAEKADAYAAMTVAIACSGTVTTELAAQGAAVVTGYKLGWITWALLRLPLQVPLLRPGECGRQSRSHPGIPPDPFQREQHRASG